MYEIFILLIENKSIRDTGPKCVCVCLCVYLCVVGAHLALLLVVLVPHLDLRGRARPVAAAALVHLLADCRPH